MLSWKMAVLKNLSIVENSQFWKKAVVYWKMLLLIVALLNIITKILNFFQAGWNFWVRVCLEALYFIL